ncbi:hypothetical protein Ddye_023032 [Dipteronia dyeriana]|uniref:Uncharacterized protein n=1 Tax=Dipteronia dyeriana TaxID=168575 RepID=A0AAD9TT35_9ROSI|nr:hypothetical protein Ddye_023032 [Dipteronia dyeriana]
MEKSCDHVSIDITKLANSLRGKFGTLYPLSKESCIYRVPPKIRMLDESLYTPTTVSIGPLHHGREELKAMEEHKLRYLQHFLRRTNVSLNDLLILAKNMEQKLRGCYAETIQLGSEDFVEMILLDVVFLLEILLRWSLSDFDRSEDRIIGEPRMIIDIRYDIWFLENQLPLFILRDLFELANPTSISLSKLTSEFFSYLYEPLLLDNNLLEKHFSEAKHFLDLLRLCLLPPRPKLDIKNESMFSPMAPTIMELHRAGVKFKVGSMKHFFDIRFHKGTLELPKMKNIGNYTGHLFRNLQLFERFHCGTNFVNDFIIILNFLINDPKDADLLVHNGVIENRAWDSEGLSDLLQQLSKNARMLHNKFGYVDLVKDLNDYCKSPWNKRRANLKQNYFNTPWASISVIAAAILLILTFIQSVCSVMGL